MQIPAELGGGGNVCLNPGTPLGLHQAGAGLESTKARILHMVQAALTALSGSYPAPCLHSALLRLCPLILAFLI